MTTFSLSGFALIGLGCPSFLIPYFVTEGRDGKFVQQLDEKLIIQSFRRFTPDHYDLVKCSPPMRQRKIGDFGLVAYQLTAEGVVVCDEPSSLRKTLAEELSTFSGSDFFKLEAANFLGIRGAVKGNCPVLC